MHRRLRSWPLLMIRHWANLNKMKLTFVSGSTASLWVCIDPDWILQLVSSAALLATFLTNPRHLPNSENMPEGQAGPPLYSQTNGWSKEQSMKSILSPINMPQSLGLDALREGKGFFSDLGIRKNLESLTCQEHHQMQIDLSQNEFLLIAAFHLKLWIWCPTLSSCRSLPNVQGRWREHFALCCLCLRLRLLKLNGLPWAGHISLLLEQLWLLDFQNGNKPHWKKFATFEIKNFGEIKVVYLILHYYCFLISIFGQFHWMSTRSNKSR